MPNRGLPLATSFRICGTAKVPVAAGSPGPQDSAYLFERFVRLIERS